LISLQVILVEKKISHKQLKRLNQCYINFTNFRCFSESLYKLALITFKCLRGLAPSYLADVCIPVSSVVGRWQLADSGTLVVPRTRTTIDRRDFAVSGPATGNSLHVELRTSSMSSLKKLKNHSLALLKTFV